MSTDLAVAKIHFIRALDALVDLHHSRLKAMTTTPVVTVPKKNRFVSFMEHIGHDIKVGFDPALKIAETAGEAAVAIFAPAASPLFNQTIGAIQTAEQNAAALGLQNAGPQKMASVINIMGGLIEQGLKDAGQPSTAADVQKYIEAALTIAKATPVSVFTAPAAPVVTQIPSAPSAPANLGTVEATTVAGTTSGPSAVASILGD